MNSILQLLRRPLKTFLGILLSLLACAIVCVCLGQYFAFLQTQTYIEENYTSVGLLTSKYMKETVYDDQGNSIGMTYYDSQPPAVQELLQELSTSEHSSVIKDIQQSLVTSGYVPEVTPLNYYADKVTPIDLDSDLYSYLSIAPYTCAMFEIQVDTVEDVRLYITYSSVVSDLSRYGYAIDLTGTILQVHSLQSAYDDPTGRTIQVTLRFDTEADALAQMPKAGEKYLVCGSDYRDLNAELRLEIARDCEIDVVEVNWNRIVWYTEEELAEREVDLGLGYYPAEKLFYSIPITEEMFHMIDGCSLTVCPNPLLYNPYKMEEDEITLGHSNADKSGNMVVSPEEYVAMYQDGNFVRLDTSGEDFLKQTTDPFWANWLNSAQINDHSFPILAVNELDAVAQFAVEDATIVEGRGYTRKEVANGAKVCVISETLALARDLHIGDTISIRFYDYDSDVNANLHVTYQSNPCSEYFSSCLGFSGEAAEYEIVGFYRQKNQWAQGTYCFTPNTIFVPGTAVSTGTRICGGTYTSVIVENGTTEQLEQLAAEHGFEGLFTCYDQGYSQIMESLQEYYNVAPVVLRTGLALWVGILALYLFLFPVQLRPDLRRMYELGTPARKMAGHVIVSSAGLILPGALAGFLVSGTLFDRMSQYLTTKFELEVPLHISAGSMGMIAAGQALVMLAIVAVFAGILTGGAKKRRRK